MTQMTSQSESKWFAPEEFESIRQRLPILYVDAIPVRVDGQGMITSVGFGNCRGSRVAAWMFRSTMSSFFMGQPWKSTSCVTFRAMLTIG